MAAIAVASAQGGGSVKVPGGTYQFTDFILPLGVVIEGAQREATILQSTIADKVVTITGQRAGFRRITLDGISQVTNSIGVFAELIDQIVFDDVQITRFATGLQRKGGTNCDWSDLYIDDCVTGYQGHGDSDSGNGGALRFNRWRGGGVSLCSTVGIELEDLDKLCDHNTFVGLSIANNTGIGVHLIGSRTTKLEDCIWQANTTDFVVEDGTPLNASQNNTIIGLEINGGSFEGTSVGSPGAITMSGTLQGVAFRRVVFVNVTITITTPLNNVLAQDCREISGVTFAGTTPTAWVRNKTNDRGTSSGLTTGNVATKAWGLELQSGQRVFLEAKVVARARNNADSAMFHFVVGAWRPLRGSRLRHTEPRRTLPPSNIVTGQTSGATARIAVDADGGTTGTLSLQDVVGTFVDNEIITDTGGGSATVNGPITLSNVALRGPNTALFTYRDDGSWAAAFVANGSEVQLNVTGDTSMNVEWVVDVDVVRAG